MELALGGDLVAESAELLTLDARRHVVGDKGARDEDAVAVVAEDDTIRRAKRYVLFTVPAHRSSDEPLVIAVLEDGVVAHVVPRQLHTTQLHSAAFGITPEHVCSEYHLRDVDLMYHRGGVQNQAIQPSQGKAPRDDAPHSFVEYARMYNIMYTTW